MSIIKLDETITVSAAQELNYVKSTMSDSAGKVKSAYHILAMDNTLTNAFNQSLITEIGKSADKLAKQRDLMSQYAAIMGQVTDTLVAADRGTTYVTVGALGSNLSWADGGLMYLKGAFEQVLKEKLIPLGVVGISGVLPFVLSGQTVSTCSSIMSWGTQKLTDISNVLTGYHVDSEVYKRWGEEVFGEYVEEGGKIKNLYSILEDIQSGNVDKDTFWDAGDLITDIVGDYEESTFTITPSKVVYTTIKTVLDKYAAEGQKYEKLALEAAKKGDYLEVAELMCKEFIDTVGKGTVDVSAQLISGVFKLEMVADTLTIITGKDVKAGVEKVTSAIEGFTDQLFGLI